jgi:hypothetical protein
MKGYDMRVMVLVKANEEIESGRMPTADELTEMGKFNEELVKAGIMLAGDGLKPSSEGKRIRFESDRRTVLDGPFAETKELVAGYWIWEVSSLEEAVEWLKKAPFSDGAEVELRPFFEIEDFGDAATPEVVEQNERLRDQIGKG